MAEIKEKNGIKWLSFDLLASCKELKHAVFLRHGGCSKAPYDSLNFSYHVEDDKEAVDSNYKRAQEILEAPTIICARLNHGVSIHAVTHSNDHPQEACDGLCTEIPDIGLSITHADCQAAILYDPIKRAVAVLHAGWRGNVQNFYQLAVAFMKKTFGSSPQNLLACISPSLGPDAAEFIHYKNELPKEFWQFSNKPNYFDFWAIANWQLRSAGVLPHHIEIAEHCTYTDQKNFYSYRRSPKNGRHATIVCLNSN